MPKTLLVKTAHQQALDVIHHNHDLIETIPLQLPDQVRSAAESLS